MTICFTTAKWNWSCRQPYFSCCVYARPAISKLATEATLMDPVTMVKYNSSNYIGMYSQFSLHDAVSGHLVHVRSGENENYECSNFTHDLPDHDWVTLVERGHCDFSEKIRVATKQYNASAIIVYDNVLSTHFVAMSRFVDDEVYLFVGQSSGRRLALLADSAMHVHVTLTAVDDSSDALHVVTAASASLLCWTVSLCVALLLL